MNKNLFLLNPLTLTKKCKRCNEDKDHAAYNKNKNRPDNLSPYCRHCSSIINNSLKSKYSKK